MSRAGLEGPLGEATFQELALELLLRGLWGQWGLPVSEALDSARGLLG